MKAMTMDDVSAWFDGADFTTDWSSRAFSTWAEQFSHMRARPLRILEIGSWEGRGSLWFLNFFPNSHLTCVDVFTLGNEGRFNSNVMAKHSSRVTKIAASSTVALDRLAADNQVFDLIYIDGSHDRDDVMIDSLMAWRLLAAPGGVMIWDDYELFAAMPGHFSSEDQNPRPAIDTFMTWHGREARVMHWGYQLIVSKVLPHYQPAKNV